MSTRFKFSVLLIAVGMLIAFLPEKDPVSFRLDPSRLNLLACSDTIYYSADQVARFLNTEDSTIRLIDVRNPKEFRESSIPGSINVPLEKFSDKIGLDLLNLGKARNIFYSNGDLLSSTAWTIAAGLGYQNSYLMKGGLNEWYKTVMHSEFVGGRISPKENSIFENRLNARRLFREFNSLPDSLKAGIFINRQVQRKKLDGGCE